ncbi:hypothetical protein OIU84_018903 [Salix udensis]|uniref:Uncharacterized protein n=1 Tax=Salix udensis TaxID=889485 RepID=A0AAD6KXL0_9ROSI|nr:hypothetical protein OIU84_018903 [Salix udensis]
MLESPQTPLKNMNLSSHNIIMPLKHNIFKPVFQFSPMKVLKFHPTTLHHLNFNHQQLLHYFQHLKHQSHPPFPPHYCTPTLSFLHTISQSPSNLSHSLRYSFHRFA